MRISVSIQLDENETISNTPDELAAEILRACEGNPETDYCSVHLTSPIQPGEAGVQPTPPPPP